MLLEKIEIRQLCQNDINDFTEMFRTYFRNDLKIEITDEKLEKICNEIANYSLLEITPLDLLTINDQVAGFVIYQIDSKESNWCEREGWGFIREIYIHHSMRGKGFGSQLVVHAEKALYEKGAKHIYLTSDEAGAFWGLCGYKATGSLSNTNHDPIYEK